MRDREGSIAIGDELVAYAAIVQRMGKAVGMVSAFPLAQPLCEASFRPYSGRRTLQRVRRTRPCAANARVAGLPKVSSEVTVGGSCRRFRRRPDYPPKVAGNIASEKKPSTHRQW